MRDFSRRSVLGSSLAMGGSLMLPSTSFAKDEQSASPESVGLSSERLELLHRKLQSFVDEGRRPGIVALIARRGKVAFHRAYGWANIGAGIPMTTDTIMRQASMTKPATCVAMLMLYEQGAFQLTDPIEKYIPAFADVQVFARRDAAGLMILEPPRRKPTIQDLFRHTAGLTYGEFGDTELNARWASDNPLGKTQSDFVKALATYPLAFHPGEKWVYSVAHDVLGHLIELFSGVDFASFVKTRLFVPLDMSFSFMGMPPAQLTPRLSALYGRNRHADGKFELLSDPAAGDTTWTGAFGGSGLWSTTHDYCRFAQMLLNGGALEGQRLLSPHTVAMMTRDQLPARVIVEPYPGQTFGLGVQVLKDPSLFGHQGSIGQYGWGGSNGTFYVADPKEEMITLWMTQGRPHDHPARIDFYNMAYASIID